MNYLFLFVLMSAILFRSASAIAGENCSQLGGRCRDVCRDGEQAEYGAFEDCVEAQECCITHDASKDQIKCCIVSFDSQHYGALNCGLPKDNRCSKGSGSPVPCENLVFCREKK